MTGLVLVGSGRRDDDGQVLRGAADAQAIRAGRALEPICSRVLVAPGDAVTSRSPWEPLEVAAGGGPLASILAALEVAETDLVAVVAAELPAADAGVLELLADTWMGEAAVVPLVDERVVPLHGVYAPSSAPAFRRLVEAGRRSVVPALSELGARVVGPDVWGAIDPEGRFARRADA